MKLKKFNGSKKQKQIIVGSIVVLLLLVGGISLYKTFALYEEKKEFNVLKGKVPDFRNTFSKYIINLSKNDETIETFEHAETVQTKALTDYRYTGANPNNYVYFGCEGDTCTEDNLYRIIGVIPTQSEIGKDKTYENRVKLIKATEYTENESGMLKPSNYTSSGKGYEWNTQNSIDWKVSTINTKILNGVYWNNLKKYQEYIAISNWYYGASDFDNWKTNSADDFYKDERSNTKGYTVNSTSFMANIGVIHPSDITYTLGEQLREKSMYEMNKEHSWLASLEKKYTWALMPDTKTNSEGMPRIWIYDGSQMIPYSVGIYRNGLTTASYKEVYNIYPTFYLKGNVLYESGNGTKENPYRVTMN